MAPERPGSDDGVITQAGLVPSLIPKEEESKARCNGEDDDLTSLTWLVQDKNLLKGINLKSGNQQTSPTSDFAEDGSIGSDRSDSSRGSLGSGGSVGSRGSGVSQNGKWNDSHLTHYDPMVHVKAKPPYSFSCLIFMAIEDSSARALPVKEIYTWIQSHFPFYRDAPAGWKNSVRHNLSLNKCFSKVEKAPNLGKGSLWMVDPAFRPNLLQSMSKAPLTSFNFVERRNNKSSSDLKSVSPSPRSSDKGSPLKSNWNPSSRLPNPDLFPFLSQRLAASENNTTDSYMDSDEELEDVDVDAATAILTLKHGPRVVIPSPDVYKRKKLSQETGNGRKGGRSGRGKKRIAVPVITSSPSEDHTYSAGPSASSPDEAYGEGSDTDDSRSDIYEGRAEEEEGAADALLNLAAVASRIKRELDDTQPAKRVRRQRLISSSGTNRGYEPTKQRSRDGNPDLVNRPSVTHADIMADLQVIRNNNNISKSELLKDKSSSAGRIKVKYPTTGAGAGDERSTVIKRVTATTRKRKQWLPGSGTTASAAPPPPKKRAQVKKALLEK